MILAQDLATTQTFIDYRPSTVALKRKPKVATGDGGWKFGAEANVGDITVRIVEMLRIQGRTERLSSSGKLVVPSHVAIAMPDVVAQRYDYFDLDDVTWEVVWVSKLPEWRKQLELVANG